MNQTLLLPISVKGIVFDEGKVWLRKNERQEWELPGGKLDPGEQPNQTVVRELREELGFTVTVEKIIGAHVLGGIRTFDEQNGVLVLMYHCNLVEKVGSFEVDGEAGKSEFAKFSIQELQSLNLPNFYFEAIKKAL